MSELFKLSGADFSPCRKYRYHLWRIWDEGKPHVMFIGLNPSTANEIKTDATISTVIRFAKSWGCGGVHMLNCFPLVSTDPAALIGTDTEGEMVNNLDFIENVARNCQLIIFAWGNFQIVRSTGMDKHLSEMFPDAKVLQLNKNGSPHHPLRLRADIIPIQYRN